ncbi:hypothetical protein Y1Q_0015798 [Alligator mississippiensis]|uniref:C-type lectin domain-containing protein n=1 Tax=Alligator mississippiensis TaxID=8496 RepID=A0A151M4L4_ALLMI|nr:hypothetical protein Y1Q_0015798 [Alligator mississippiensis]
MLHDGQGKEMGTTARLCFCLLGCLALSPWLEGAAPEVESCPRGWLFYRGNCYGLFLQPLPWAEAEWKAEHCAAESAFLCQCRQPQCPA